MSMRNPFLQIGAIVLFSSLALFASSTKQDSLQVYGAGEKLDDKSYDGVGVKYQSPNSEATIEYGNDYEKASAIYKLDIDNYIYSKFGLGYLERELLINSQNKDVDQKTGGVAIGYGDNKLYNLEVGHIISKLDGANDADGYSRISYIEALGKYDLGDMGSIDATGVYKNTHVYTKNYSDYSLEVGYYPIKDIKLSSKYDSVDKDKDNYTLKAGIEYIFATSEFKPYLTASRQSSKNLSFALTYENAIANKALNMRDEFENVVGTSDIVAQKVAPSVFDSKANPTTASSTAPVWNSSTINSGVTVTDAGDGVQVIQDLAAVSSDPNGNPITYSIVSISAPSTLTAWNSSISISGNTLQVQNANSNDPDGSGTVSVVVKATSSGGTSNATITFTFTNTM